MAWIAWMLQVPFRHLLRLPPVPFQQKFFETCSEVSRDPEPISETENGVMSSLNTESVLFRWWRTPIIHHHLTFGEPGSLDLIFPHVFFERHVFLHPPKKKHSLLAQFFMVAKIFCRLFQEVPTDNMLIGISPAVSFVGCESGLGCVAMMCAQQSFHGVSIELALTRKGSKSKCWNRTLCVGYWLIQSKKNTLKHNFSNEAWYQRVLYNLSNV